MPTVYRERKETSSKETMDSSACHVMDPTPPALTSSVRALSLPVPADSVLSSLAVLILTGRRQSLDSTLGNIRLEKSEHVIIEKSMSTVHHTLNNLLLMSDRLLIVEVKGHPFGNTAISLLIERWTLRLLSKKHHHLSTATSVQCLVQAIKSFLHFSQINSWAVSLDGHLPFSLLYKLKADSCDDDNFLVSQPECHSFPLAITQSFVVQVIIEYLPRLNQIPSQLLGDGPGKGEIGGAFGCNGSHDVSNESHDISNGSHDISNGSHDISNGSNDISNGSHDISNGSHALSNGFVEEFQKLEISSTNRSKPHPTAPPTSGTTPVDGLSLSCLSSSSLSPKLNSLSPVTGTIHSSTSSSSSNDDTTDKVTLRRSSSRQIKLSSGGVSQVPSNWRGGVRPPGASSPVPSLLSAAPSVNGCYDYKDIKRLKRRSVGINMRRVPPSRPLPVRSMSLPAAVPNLCLLGTFEESVLNGRLEPCGFVEGFTAELGASGSFCPQHITIPVTASFFNLSDDGGPSPYLGHLDLSNVGRRGYRVPMKGTIQLTLFNPNKTVVKIYIVTYDHSDMPPSTSTFIRQKTITQDSVCPLLQYLIHLRFLCSKSHRLYLHTDIKLIFARRAPDSGDPDLSKVSLVTNTEGPTNPKYGPLADMY